MTNKKFLILSIFTFFFFASDINAAALSLLPQARTFDIGQEFGVDIIINTEEAYINAAQATILFPAGSLELLSVDRTGSVFGFWTDEPGISNEDGTLIFTGGTTKGIAGGALQVLKMKFKAKNAGFAELNIRDAAVTASDGRGTNILSALKGTSITIGAGTAVIAPAEPPPVKLPDTAITTPPPEAPKKIIREPVAAKNLPQKPQLRVPLYPDEARWYNHVGEVMVFWNLPPDVLQVSTRLSRAPDKLPGEKDAELFTGKNFGVLKEGIWYIRVQFRNNVGWGEIAYYKISIDTTVPSPFDIKMDAPASDNPAPEIRYEAHDALSGISHALIFVDDKEFLRSTTTAMALPVQALGKHALLIRIFDLAGNSVESDIAFEILPLPAPVIEFFTESASQGESIFISGRSIPNISVEVRAIDASAREVFRGSVLSDGSGNWKIAIDRPLATGKYTILAIARDERGAKSYPAEEKSFTVRPKTILSFGLIDLGWFEIFLISMLVIISGASLIAWRYVAKKSIRDAYKIIVGRDIEKLGTILSDDLKELEGLQESHDPSRSTQSAAGISRMKETILKMKKYIGEEVRKLK